MQKIRIFFIGALLRKASGPIERGRITLCFWFVFLYLLTELLSILLAVFYGTRQVTVFLVVLIFFNIAALFSLRLSMSTTIAVLLQTGIVLVHAFGNSYFSGGNLSIILFIWPLIYTFFLNFIAGNKATFWYIILFSASITGLSLLRSFGIIVPDVVYDHRITANTWMIMLLASVFLYLFTTVFGNTRNEIAALQLASVESRDTILHLVTNDLSNTVGGLMISLDLLSLTIQDRKYDEAVEILKLFERNVDNSANIINDLLESSSLPVASADLKLTTVDIPSLMRRLGEYFNSAMEKKNIRFHLEQPSGPVRIVADEEQLYKVFANLMSNAVKFTPAGGAVTVTVTDGPDHLLIAVKDTGIGMSEELAGRLFVAFTKTARKGTDGERSTGLGMYIVKTILNAHKATISVQSETGQGSEFTVRLYRRRSLG